MPARSPSLVLRAVMTTTIAEATLVAAVIFPYYADTLTLNGLA